MLVPEGLLDEVLAPEGERLLHVEIHEHLQTIVAKSLLDAVHHLEEALLQILIDVLSGLLLLGGVNYPLFAQKML